MKKTIIFGMMLLTAVSASAQKYWDGSRPDHPVTLGVRAGLNMSKLFDQNDEWRNTMGWQAGMEVDFNLVRSLSLNTGAYYIQKGYKLELEYVQNYRVEYEFKVNYLEVPVALSYRIKLSDSSQFQINAGGYFAYGLSGDYFSGRNTYKKEDIGATMGVAVTYSHYYASASWERSLLDISKDSSKAYNSNILVSLGYNF